MLAVGLMRALSGYRDEGAEATGRLPEGEWPTLARAVHRAGRYSEDRPRRGRQRGEHVTKQRGPGRTGPAGREGDGGQAGVPAGVPAASRAAGDVLHEFKAAGAGD